MAAFDSCDLEPGLPQGRDDFATGESAEDDSRHGDLLNTTEVESLDVGALDLKT
jgi:hypothetical protein